MQLYGVLFPISDQQLATSLASLGQKKNYIHCNVKSKNWKGKRKNTQTESRDWKKSELQCVTSNKKKLLSRLQMEKNSNLVGFLKISLENYLNGRNVGILHLNPPRQVRHPHYTGEYKIRRKNPVSLLHCKYIRCKNYSFSLCPVSRCIFTVFFTLKKYLQ